MVQYVVTNFMEEDIRVEQRGFPNKAKTCGRNKTSGFETGNRFAMGLVWKRSAEPYMNVRA